MRKKYMDEAFMQGMQAPFDGMDEQEPTAEERDYAFLPKAPSEELVTYDRLMVHYRIDEVYKKPSNLAELPYHPIYGVTLPTDGDDKANCDERYYEYSIMRHSFYYRRLEKLRQSVDTYFKEGFFPERFCEEYPLYRNCNEVMGEVKLECCSEYKRIIVAPGVFICVYSDGYIVLHDESMTPKTLVVNRCFDVQDVEYSADKRKKKEQESESTYPDDGFDFFGRTKKNTDSYDMFDDDREDDGEADSPDAFKKNKRLAPGKNGEPSKRYSATLSDYEDTVGENGGSLYMQVKLAADGMADSMFRISIKLTPMKENTITKPACSTALPVTEMPENVSFG